MPFFSGRCTSDAKLVGKTAIVTGCNTGIGKETVLDFYKRGARVIMACRNLEKAQEAKSDIEEKCKKLDNTGSLVIVKCDLTSLSSVRECAQKIMDTESQINILVNNAGVMMCPKEETEDGFDIQFATNHLAPFLLTMLLLPRIRSSKPARIVNVSSLAHTRGEIDFEDLNYKKRTYSEMGAYSQSKLANVLFAKGLAEKFKEYNIDGITTYSLHPGIIKTDISRHFDKTMFWGARVLVRYVMGPFLKTPQQGAQTTIYCAVDENCASETGLYYSDCVAVQPSPAALDYENIKKLMDISSQLVGLGDFNPYTAKDPGVKGKN